jgi:PhnB protein
MHVQSYLNFNGRCEEALEFYKQALGGQTVMLVRFKDMPDPKPPGMIPAGAENKMMHARFRIGDTVLLASDGQCTGQPTYEGMSLSITADDEAAAERIFAALADGGQVQMPLAKTFFSPSFGMLADRFGVPWMVYVQP